MADPAVLKQLKIKTGVVKRLIKEHSSYIKEVEKETAKVAQLKAAASNEDEEYAAKKAEQVLQETRGMIGDTLRRCRIAAEELNKLLQESGLDEELQEAKDAKEQLRLAGEISA